MTFAWYGISIPKRALGRSPRKLGIAFRILLPVRQPHGSYEFTTAHETIQESNHAVGFSVFSVLYLGEKLKWNYAADLAASLLPSFCIHSW